MVHIRWDKFVSAFPVLSDDTAVFCTGVIVKYLVIHCMAMGPETFHEPIVGGNAMPVVTGLEKFDENGIGVAVVCYHHILIAAARLYREATHVICE
jgi:hypothetical protein